MVERAAVGAVASEAAWAVEDGVVEHDVDREVGRHAGVDGIEEAAELLRPMAWEAAPDHVAGGDIERGEQRGRAVAPIVVRAPLGLAGPQRQEWLRAVERLDLGLLVHAQHDRPIGRLKLARSSGYDPGMSRTFSTNSGSVESLNVSCRCGCSPNACQMRWMVEGA